MVIRQAVGLENPVCLFASVLPKQEATECHLNFYNDEKIDTWLKWISGSIVVISVYLIWDKSLLFGDDINYSKTSLAIGTVHQTTQDVRLKFGQAVIWLPANGNEQVAEADSLYTGDNSSADIDLTDGSKIQVAANTLISFERSPAANTHQIRLSGGQLKGQFNAGTEIVLPNKQVLKVTKESDLVLRVNKNKQIDMAVITGEAKVADVVVTENKILAIDEGGQSQIQTFTSLPEVFNKPLSSPEVIARAPASEEPPITAEPIVEEVPEEQFSRAVAAVSPEEPMETALPQMHRDLELPAKTKDRIPDYWFSAGPGFTNFKFNQTQNSASAQFTDNSFSTITVLGGVRITPNSSVEANYSQHASRAKSSDTTEVAGGSYSFSRFAGEWLWNLLAPRPSRARLNLRFGVAQEQLPFVMIDGTTTTFQTLTQTSATVGSNYEFYILPRLRSSIQARLQYPVSSQASISATLSPQYSFAGIFGSSYIFDSGWTCSVNINSQKYKVGYQSTSFATGSTTGTLEIFRTTAEFLLGYEF